MPETAARPDPLYPPVIGVCGQSGSGKTLLIQQLVPRLIARGLCPAVVKRCTHRIEADRPGKDSDRVFQAGADVLAAGPQESFARFHAEHMSLEECLRRVSGKCDLVLVEGCREAAIPKIWLTQRPDEVPAASGESLLVVPDASHGRAAEQAVWQVVERVHAGLPVLAAVLIGGRSRRMGSPKHLLKQEQVTLLERVVTAVRAHIADVVLIGTGKVPPSLLGLGRLPDAPGTEGPTAGVLSAMRWRPGARWLVLACDLARITPDAVAWLLAQARPGLDAVMPALPGRPTCEPLFAVYEPTARWFVELAAARGEFSLRRALQLGRVLRPQPPCDMQTAWTNVNTREEWHRIERPSDGGNGA